MRSNGPHSELYLRGDMYNMLRSINAANAELAAAMPGTQVAAYRSGFIAALRAVALAVNVEPPAEPPIIDAQPATRALPAGRVNIGTRPTNEFEALLVGLGADGLAAFKEIVSAVSRCPDKQTRDRVIDEYIQRIDNGWPGWMP